MSSLIHSRRHKALRQIFDHQVVSSDEVLQVIQQDNRAIIYLVHYDSALEHRIKIVRFDVLRAVVTKSPLLRADGLSIEGFLWRKDQKQHRRLFLGLDYEIDQQVGLAQRAFHTAAATLDYGVVVRLVTSCDIENLLPTFENIEEKG